MSRRQYVQLGAIAVQTAIVALIVGRLVLLTVPGQVLAVLLVTIGSLVAAGRRRPLLLVPGSVVAALAVAGARLPAVLLVLLGLAMTVQVLVADASPLTATRPVLLRLLTAGLLSIGIATAVGGLDRAPAWLALAGTATLGIAGVAALLAARRAGT